MQLDFNAKVQRGEAATETDRGCHTGNKKASIVLSMIIPASRAHSQSLLFP
jgi:hypothetical protein